MASKNKTNKANYSLGEKIKLFFSFVYTKIFWKKARLIRLPCHIRGKKAFAYGKGLTIGYYSRINIIGSTKTKKLYVGKHCVIGDYVHIEANFEVIIGDNVLIASRVLITDTNHGFYSGDNQSNPSQVPIERPLQFKRVCIGNNVWIGENAYILPGVSLGDGCVVGAGAVVTKSFEAGSIIAGNPARLIKRFNYTSKIYESVK